MARALAVLALILVGFAHAPALDGGGRVLVAASASSFCGGAPSDPRGHAPCPACRIAAGTDLPTPCAVASPAFLSAMVAFAQHSGRAPGCGRGTVAAAGTTNRLI